MLSRTYSRWDRFYNIDALKSAPFVTNGQCVQQVMEGGFKKGRPSNGTDDTFFLGVSYGIYKGVGPTTTKIETVTVGSANGGVATALLSKPVAGDITVYKGADYTGTAMTPTANDAAPTGASDYDLAADNRTITVDDQNAGATLFVIYSYSPTEQDRRFLYEGGGDYYPGNNAPLVFGQVGVITEGIVYTDQFAKNVNWNSVAPSTPIKGAANGIFTVGGTGCVCTGVKVHAVPTADVPFLGLTLGPSI
jgi:hypothetical protein